jgi:hypothetical protein
MLRGTSAGSLFAASFLRESQTGADHEDNDESLFHKVFFVKFAAGCLSPIRI